ncbi:hypothetical protein [Terasakiella pusilla]|uniref:hypothetical protein n=1 Tax=Terasakiella pusilla TaxID=64973 RepID=UPI003AA8B598
MNILVVYNHDAYHVGTIKDHLNAYKAFSSHRVVLIDYRTLFSTVEDVDVFDVIVVHYSLSFAMEGYDDFSCRRTISGFKGYKVIYIQDEYRWIDNTVKLIAELGIDVIYTVLNPDIVDKVYHHAEIAHVRRKLTLTGFVPENLLNVAVPSYQDRKIDIGYRVRKVPYWLGVLGQEKWLLGAKFKQIAEKLSLKVDIEFDETKRLYGDKWINFVSGCKAMLGAESKISYFDFSGETRLIVDKYCKENPDATFEEVQEKFLKENDQEIICHVISPRCFEAAALRTLMVMYPGEYSGRLEPWRHYVPLEFDHSNIDEVIAIVNDPVRAGLIIENAYNEVALNKNNHFSSMVRQFCDDLAEHYNLINERKVLAGKPFEADVESIFRDIEERSRRKLNGLKLRNGVKVFGVFIIKILVPKRYQRSLVERIKKIVRI